MSKAGSQSLRARFTRAFQASLNADEVEEKCLADVRTSSEASLLDERIVNEDEDAPAPSQFERAFRATRTLDDVAGEVAEELQRRAGLAGQGYPFKFNGKSLEYVGSKSLVYEFCLAICRAESITQEPFTRLPRNFERLSTLVAQLYLGKGAEGRRLGWPRDDEDPQDYPTDFKGRADLLANLAPKGSEEWEWAPAKDFDAAAENANDHGMDFIAWKPFPDRRIGHLTLLGQCACGKGDQDDPAKASELSFGRLRNIFRRLTWLEPVRIFATPYHVNDARKFKDLHVLPNLVLDRARMAAICEENAKEQMLTSFRPRFEQLIRMVFAQFKQPAGNRRSSSRKRAS